MAHQQEEEQIILPALVAALSAVSGRGSEAVDAAVLGWLCCSSFAVA
jgi:hypothetical protein